ncbi:MAG: hypothetical protein JRN16_01970 [Nitrososphaerota archaeon]|nr:hypothetical protein [Nitrososphaerota archaeon]MDG7030933.1 hypothetical protein [Nitrososphaerota archaeon]
MRSRIPGPFEEARPIIEEDLGPIDSVFDSDESAISGASLGQVYGAHYEGKDVVVKVNRSGDSRSGACRRQNPLRGLSPFWRGSSTGGRGCPPPGDLCGAGTVSCQGDRLRTGVNPRLMPIEAARMWNPVVPPWASCRLG